MDARRALGVTKALATGMSILIAAGCASTRPANPQPTASARALAGDSGESEAAGTEQEPPSALSPKLGTPSALAPWIEYFTRTDRERFQRFLSRGSRYRKVIEDVLLENQLPPELYFLALIESGYQNHATSSAQAAGVWQFIPATGRRYGLQIDRYVDERRDPIRSTEAAARYLRDLYNIFGSWPLAMAAYNSGEYRVIRAIIKGKTRDFWTLSELGILPRETREYVPKILAAVSIGSDPEAHGFESGGGGVPYPELEAESVPSPIKLADLARYSGLSLAELKEFNPHLTRAATPANQARYEVWLPRKSALLVRRQKSKLALLRQAEPRASRSLASAARPSNYHRVKAGETLDRIARKYGKSTSYLRKVNRLKSNRILAGFNLRLTSRSYQPKATIRVVVKRGDTLLGIAKRYRSTVRKLRQSNSLRKDRLYPGQVLLISKPGT
jgi:membrane-bound lytic murein transglycosylase D